MRRIHLLTLAAAIAVAVGVPVTIHYTAPPIRPRTIPPRSWRRFA